MKLNKNEEFIFYTSLMFPLIPGAPNVKKFKVPDVDFFYFIHADANQTPKYT